jgi:hypothetical protein
MGGSGFEGSSGAGGSARPTRRMSRPRCPGLGPALALALAPSRGPWCAADAGAEARGAGTEVVGYGGGGGWVGGQDRMEGGGGERVRFFLLLKSVSVPTELLDGYFTI